MKEIVDKIIALQGSFASDAVKADTNKAAGSRARKASLELAKLYKEFRKVSIENAKK